LSTVLIGVGYIAVYAALGWALRAHPFARSVFGNIGVMVPAMAVVAIVLWRRRLWAGRQRLFWEVMAIGMAVWTVGHFGWAFGELILGQPSWVQWHTLFSCSGGTAPLLALLVRPHRGARQDSVATRAVDVASYGVLTAFIYTYFVMVPSLVGRAELAQTTLLWLVQTLRLVTVIALIAMVWDARQTAWRATFARLAAGFGVGFALRAFTSLAIARGDYQIGSLYDLAWVAPWLCIAWAAAEAPATPVPVHGEAVPSAAPSPLVAAIPVFLIPLIGYGSLQAISVGPTGDSFRALITSLMTVAGIALLTLRLATQRAELQRADARIRLLAAATEQSGDLILIIRADGRFEHANDAFLRAVGCARADLSTVSLVDLTEPQLDRTPADTTGEAARRGIWRGTVTRRRRDGSTFPAASTLVALRDARGAITHFVAVERDITEELKLRDQLVQAERLSAIGALVAGVAHELNNPLQAVLGSAELMIEAHVDGPYRRELDAIRRESARAAQIIRSLLAFVHRSTPGRAEADLNEIVRSTIELRTYHLNRVQVSVVPRLHGGALPVFVNRDEIQQIVVNLLLNAEQALRDEGRGGTITIRTASEGPRHFVEIADDGPGVSEDVRGRLFEPFFTTKPVGEGTGLGLSIAHGLATAHQGRLELTASQTGACFRLTLPASADTLEPHARPPSEVPRLVHYH
jgi:PAS domain S-box-containing protein